MNAASPSHPATARHTAWRRVSAALAISALSLLAIPGVGLQAQPVDPALEQRVTIDEPVIVDESVIINQGHVDLGPYLDESGQLQFYARDDASISPVWRPTEDVIFGVGEAAEIALPDDANYNFIGAAPGDTVWVVPQTEIQGVPWVGWNTQSPTIAEIADKGVTLEFVGHAGPGEHSVFLQPGGFAEPDVLWTKKEPGSIWVEPHTHTHANWVFTEPGSHLVVLRATIETAQGETHTAEATLRFAVGIDPLEYQAPSRDEVTSGSSATLWYTIAGVAVAIVVVAGVIIWVVRRGNHNSSAEDEDER